jgi:hypothetical protein
MRFWILWVTAVAANVFGGAHALAADPLVGTTTAAIDSTYDASDEARVGVLNDWPNQYASSLASRPVEGSALSPALASGAFTTPASASVATEAGTTRVGRWMGEAEYDAMSSSGRVAEGAGGRTFVVEPPNPAAFPSAKAGSVYAEFDVPTPSLKPAGKPEWSVIPGPNAGTTRFGPLPTEMPPATNICLVCRK